LPAAEVLRKQHWCLDTWYSTAAYWLLKSANMLIDLCEENTHHVHLISWSTDHDVLWQISQIRFWHGIRQMQRVNVHFLVLILVTDV
jgi:hypothetical protein